MAKRKTADDPPNNRRFPLGPNFDEASLVPQIRKLAHHEALNISHHEADADDLAQTVAFTCLEKLRRGELLLNAPSIARLVKVMVRCQSSNLLTRAKRRSRRDAVHYAESSGVAHAWSKPDQSGEESSLDQLRERIMENLPLPWKESLVMVRETPGKHKYKVVAAKLGFTADTVRAYTHKAQSQLRDDLAAAGIYAPPLRRKRK